MPGRETAAVSPYFKHVHLARVKISPLSFAALNIRSKLSASGNCIIEWVICSIKSNLNFKDWQENRFSSSKPTPQSVATIPTVWNSPFPWYALEVFLTGLGEEPEIVFGRRFWGKRTALPPKFGYRIFLEIFHEGEHSNMISIYVIKTLFWKCHLSYSFQPF